MTVDCTTFCRSSLLLPRCLSRPVTWSFVYPPSSNRPLAAEPMRSTYRRTDVSYCRSGPARNMVLTKRGKVRRTVQDGALIRPPDIVCRRTYILPVFLSSSSFFLSSFFRRLISEVAERNSTKIGHMVGSKCNLKTHVRNLGYPLPLQIGGPKTTFLDDITT